MLMPKRVKRRREMCIRDSPTAEWVFKEAKKQMLTIGIATVYRNLHALVEQGEIERIAVPGDMDRFDGYMEEHFHMKCIKCGSLVDLEPKNSQSVNKLKEIDVYKRQILERHLE